MADRRIVQCVAAFHAVGADGTPRVVRTGQLYFADDPIVRGREAMFADVIVMDSGLRKPPRTAVASVEEATSPPGGRRRMSRPKDDVKPEGDAKPKDDEV